MDLLLTRDILTPFFTIGTLTIDGRDLECYTMEDTVREVPGEPVEKWKIWGQTAIPYGRYEVEITFSRRFQRPLPLLLNVPGFDGIRIHAGNTQADTEGCILVGMQKMGDSIRESRIALTNLIAILLDINEAIYITIMEGDGD